MTRSLTVFQRPAPVDPAALCIAIRVIALVAYLACGVPAPPTRRDPTGAVAARSKRKINEVERRLAAQGEDDRE